MRSLVIVAVMVVSALAVDRFRLKRGWAWVLGYITGAVLAGWASR